MTATTSITTKRQLVLAIAAVGLVCCLMAILSAGTACALDEPEYTPGEDYYIDTPEAYEEQDIEHNRAQEMESSTQYYISSPFYLNWITPDQVIYEGDDARIGCEATGLNDLHYVWELSRDGGFSFEETGLEGNSHTVSGLTVNDPATQPYLYRCTITNGDCISTLTATVTVTVLPANQTAANSANQSSSSLVRTGDDTLDALIWLCVSALFASLALLIVHRIYRKNDQMKSKSHGTPSWQQDLHACLDAEGQTALNHAEETR